MKTKETSMSGSNKKRIRRPGAPKRKTRLRLIAVAGFTLIEVLIAMTVTLIMMAIVVKIFADIGDGVSNRRSVMEMVDRLRATSNRLQADLGGLTVQTLPPLHAEQGSGYLEITDDLVLYPPSVPGVDENGKVVAFDTTLGDIGDTLAFTTRAPANEFFVGRFRYKDTPGPSDNIDGSDAIGNYTLRDDVVQSPVAEVIWFLRGTTLYRRQLLVLTTNLPDFDLRTPVYDEIPPITGFYSGFDLSARQEGGTLDPRPTPAGNRIAKLSLNSLADLTKRENRFGHQPIRWPHVGASFWGRLGMPTLQECSDPAWPFPIYEPFVGSLYNGVTGLITPNIPFPLTTASGNEEFNPWSIPHPWQQVDPATGISLVYSGGDRLAEDVIMNNVLSFDIKVWDPYAPIYSSTLPNGTVVAVQPSDTGYIDTAQTGALPIGYGAYVDLNYISYPPGSAAAPAGIPAPLFSNPGALKSGLMSAGVGGYATYDTGSFSYEQDGLDQDRDGVIDSGTDLLDNDGQNGVDDALELESPPPYSVPLRGMQIKIRCFEPNSRTVNEVTIIRDFLPE